VHETSSVIDSLAPDARRGLLQRAAAQQLHRGQALHLTGESGARTHLLVRGVVKLCARNVDGGATILGLALAGDLIGDVALLDGRGQPLDAIAATRCDLMSLSSEALLEALASSPEAALEMARALARRHRWLSEAAMERSTSPVPARLAGRLLDLAAALGRAREGTVELELPVAQEDLGRLAGMSRESACKTLRALQRAGVLTYRGRRVRILRPDALERLRCCGRR
jgi:CRP/FNR family cyclic AMP-dependent transcriptional regulator